MDQSNNALPQSLMLLIKAFLTFSAAEFLIIVIVTLIWGNGEMQWVGAGIFMFIILFVAAPFNTLMIYILHRIKPTNGLCESTIAIFIESLLYFATLQAIRPLGQHLSEFWSIAFFTLPSVIIMLLSVLFSPLLRKLIGFKPQLNK